MKLSVSVAVALVAALAASVRAQEDAAVVIPNFPYCQCQETPGAYYLSPVVTSKGSNTYCFKVIVKPPPGCTEYCCTKADLKKIEMDANPACKVAGIKLSATINGKPSMTAPIVDRSFAGPAGTFVLKLTNIGLTLATANNTEICYTLGTNSAGQGCTTLEQMCVPPAGSPKGVCQAALFDTQNDCCPISKPGNPAPPPPRSPPPSPPPPVPPTPCKTCVYLNLQPPAVNPLGGSFSAGECAAYSARIIKDIKDAAASVGARITVPFALDSCAPYTIKICGTFFSDEDGAKLSGSLNDALQFWLQLITPTDNCGPQYFGYTISVIVGGDGPVTAVPPSCLNGTASLSCKPSDVPFPKCQCDTDRFASPFAVEPTITDASIPAPAGSYLRCFHIKVVEPALGSPCADAKIMSKIEFFANEKYRRKILNFYLKPAGRPTYRTISPSWGAVGEETLKATPLNWNTTQADGAEVCFQLATGTSLSDFCQPGNGQCWANIFDPTKACCPLYAAVYDPAP